MRSDKFQYTWNWLAIIFIYISTPLGMSFQNHPYLWMEPVKVAVCGCSCISLFLRIWRQRRGWGMLEMAELRNRHHHDTICSPGRTLPCLMIWGMTTGLHSCAAVGNRNSSLAMTVLGWGMAAFLLKMYDLGRWWLTRFSTFSMAVLPRLIQVLRTPAAWALLLNYWYPGEELTKFWLW